MKLLNPFINFVRNLKEKTIPIWSDHGREFGSKHFEWFCNNNGIHHNFFTLQTIKQNESMERKNRQL